MLVEFSEASLLGKARRQPEKVRQVLDKIKADGLLPTLEAVFARLDEPMPLGYCNAGIALEVGEGVRDIRQGDRVASNGNHAEIVCVPKNLCAPIPNGVSDEEAAFTVISSVALQGVRLAAPTIGERVAVLGLGLVGLITVQILRANGCQVLGTDFSPDRLRLAESFGAEVVDLSTGADPVAAAEAFSSGRGVDAVIVAASTKSPQPLEQAAKMCRKRGRIVLVGVVGLEFKRADLYEKEISFQVSCSYGPGRYDPLHENAGQDYPFGFVRWTEKRNFEAVLQLMAEGKLNVKPLISERAPFLEAPNVYKRISARDSIGTVFVYPDAEPDRGITVSATPVIKRVSAPGVRTVTVGAIGAGNFARTIQFPILKTTSACLRWVADRDPLACRHAARKFGFQKATSDYREILADPEVNAVFVTVPHALHARIACEALEAGKYVFVEKPLSVDLAGVKCVRDALAKSGCHLMVGFNRRFSPHVLKMAQLLRSRSGPLCLNMMVNAGAVPASNWVQDPQVGGGRMIGEGCHFVDTLRFLVRSPVVSVSAVCVANSPDGIGEDKAAVLLSFADGSVGTLNYFATGHRSYPKEQLQVFCDGKVLHLQNFRNLRGYGWSRFRTMKLWRQDKGHRNEIVSFMEQIAQGADPLIPYEEIEEVTLATFCAVRSMREGGKRVALADLRAELPSNA
jgi:predicted dehydrogenase